MQLIDQINRRVELGREFLGRSNAHPDIEPIVPGHGVRPPAPPTTTKGERLAVAVAGHVADLSESVVI